MNTSRLRQFRRRYKWYFVGNSLIVQDKKSGILREYWRMQDFLDEAISTLVGMISAINYRRRRDCRINQKYLRDKLKANGKLIRTT